MSKWIIGKDQHLPVSVFKSASRFWIESWSTVWVKPRPSAPSRLSSPLRSRDCNTVVRSKSEDPSLRLRALRSESILSSPPRPIWERRDETGDLRPRRPPVRPEDVLEPVNADVVLDGRTCGKA